jgi:RNA polymerase sigma factor (sigma-70 family)
MDVSKITKYEEAWPLWVTFLRDRSSFSIRNKLADYYHFLVVTTFHRTYFEGLAKSNEPDIIQEGYIGLITAIDSYDLAKQVLFETWAINKIKWYMLEYRREKETLLSLPRSYYDMENAYMEARDLYASIFKCFPEYDAELALLLDCETDVVTNIRQYIEAGKGIYLAPALATEDGTEQRLPSIDEYADTSSGANPTSFVLGNNQTDCIMNLVDKALQNYSREKEVFFLHCLDEMSFKQIAAKFEISESRAYQLYYQALDRIKRVVSVSEELSETDDSQSIPAVLIPNSLSFVRLVKKAKSDHFMATSSFLTDAKELSKQAKSVAYKLCLEGGCILESKGTDAEVVIDIYKAIATAALKRVRVLKKNLTLTKKAEAAIIDNVVSIAT